ncbi:histidine phosphatase family protein [Allobranchiibius sp. GilTou38]|uniref:histidine phosphatase family protein n=1 Tax=Allobranchiibius sp. GilTou38 TaxID=2815210 RepID=UPI001AA18C03|nr:histidine phosphatase family protein [Allobranchiibius sp. GilTou38]MBO1766026.1 histidine phosphatase family protein [Allobranchiibius sp. GilTou38]
MTGGDRTIVHLVRHGEVYNPGKVLYGRMPGFKLSELGVRMAHMTAAYLADNDIAHLVSSPLERAQQTIEPLAEVARLPVTLDDRVIEADNDFEGLTVGASPRQLLQPRFWPKLVNPVKPSWGEPYVQIAARMRAAIADARVKAEGREAVIVSHQLPVWISRLDAEHRRLWHNPRNRECTLASVTSLTFRGPEVTMVTYAEPAASLLPLASAVVGA